MLNPTHFWTQPNLILFTFLHTFVCHIALLFFSPIKVCLITCFLWKTWNMAIGRLVRLVKLSKYERTVRHIQHTFKILILHDHMFIPFLPHPPPSYHIITLPSPLGLIHYNTFIVPSSWHWSILAVLFTQTWYME